jgi:hypothetical protein
VAGGVKVLAFSSHRGGVDVRDEELFDAQHRFYDPAAIRGGKRGSPVVVEGPVALLGLEQQVVGREIRGGVVDVVSTTGRERPDAAFQQLRPPTRTPATSCTSKPFPSPGTHTSRTSYVGGSLRSALTMPACGSTASSVANTVPDVREHTKIASGFHDARDLRTIQPHGHVGVLGVAALLERIVEPSGSIHRGRRLAAATARVAVEVPGDVRHV